MRLPRRAWLLGALPALALACQLVDPESDLKDLALPDGGGAPDGSLAPGADAANAGDASTDAASSDATIGDASDAALCQLPANRDAAICDDFNRYYLDLVLDGGPNWALSTCAGPKDPGIEYGGFSLNLRLPSGPVDADSCYLQSLPKGPAKIWNLDFDLDGSVYAFTTGGDASYLALTQLDFAYDASAAGALTAQSFRLLVGTDNSAKLDLIQTRVGLGASTRTMLATGEDQPFLAGNDVPCHVHLHVDLPGPQNSMANATCVGQGLERLNALDPPDTPGMLDGGVGVLLFGYQDFGGTFPASQFLDYDNVVLLTQ